MAPGATACVLGPNGMWAGAAGVANINTGDPMAPSARMRTQSNSKPWLMAVIFQLVNDGHLGLDDTVERWLVARPTAIWD